MQLKFGGNMQKKGWQRNITKNELVFFIYKFPTVICLFYISMCLWIHPFSFFLNMSKRSLKEFVGPRQRSTGELYKPQKKNLQVKAHQICL